MPRSRKAEARQEHQSNRRGRQNHQPLIDMAVAMEGHRERKKALIQEVKPLTQGQRVYDAAMRSSEIVFGIGPAGTGKTWFAVQRAAQALKNKVINKIYVTRPAVEVERSMGFLPGELEEKYEPYLLPLKEAFVDAFGEGHYENLVRNKVIDARPLAFMRGTTIKDGWLIADEMQNATESELKMLLTRFGQNAKFILNGDLNQIDRGVRSGLADAIRRIGSLDEVTVVEFARDEIVRHGIVQKIVEAYEEKSDNYQEDNSDGLKRFLHAA